MNHPSRVACGERRRGLQGQEMRSCESSYKQIHFKAKVTPPHLSIYSIFFSSIISQVKGFIPYVCHSSCVTFVQRPIYPAHLAYTFRSEEYTLN